MNTKNTLGILLALIFGFAPQISADDPLPAGLDQAIRNPKIPMIIDATILKYNKAGHGEIKVHTIYKPAIKGKNSKVAPPKWIRGYGYVGNDKVAPLRIVAGGRPGRFLLFLDGDLLYSTYNNRFPIREGKNGALEVGIGFNGGGAPWKPLKDMVKLIPGQKKSTAWANRPVSASAATPSPAARTSTSSSSSTKTPTRAASS